MAVEPQSESTPSISNALPKDRRVDALGDLRVLPDETLCAILTYLSPRDVGRVACVSSVMYILCNEEPLWMSLCLQNAKRSLQYKGSWKKTTLHQYGYFGLVKSMSYGLPNHCSLKGFTRSSFIEDYIDVIPPWVDSLLMKEVWNEGIICLLKNLTKILTVRNRRETLSSEDTSSLASFLGEKLRFLHLLPCPSYNESGIAINELKSKIFPGNGFSKVGSQAEHLFMNILNNRKEDIRSRLTMWGHPIPSGLIDRVVEYLPEDFGMFFTADEDDMNVSRFCTWIHNDVMDDNIQLEPYHVGSSSENTYDSRVESEQIINGSEECGQTSLWRPCHLIDFSNLSLGHPICDIIPLHLDVFRGDYRLMQQFLEAYKLPFVPKESRTDKFGRASYLAM